MSFSWENYLDLANGLVGNKNIDIANEACIRTSISRSFYAAYNIIYDYFALEDRNTPKGLEAYKWFFRKKVAIIFKSH
ncbi:MAG: hypothetical protein PHD33_05595 [Atribacterota bacterium]|nr:hypothetical protein [Atribacterota bacterium]